MPLLTGCCHGRRTRVSTSKYTLIVISTGVNPFDATNVNGRFMLEYTCKDSAFSASLGWAEPETGLIFCIHPQMGHHGNWARRVLNAEDKACACVISREQRYQALSKTVDNTSL